MRRCPGCREDKPDSAFGNVKPKLRSGRRDGKISRCKKCSSEIESTRQKRAADVKRGDLPAVPDYAAVAAFATDPERLIIEAMVKTGDFVRAADQLGITPRDVRLQLYEVERRAAKRGWIPGEPAPQPVPVGYHVKGMSTYTDGEGNVVGRWVKTQKDPDSKLEYLLAAIATLPEPFRGALDPVPPPAVTSSDILNVIPMGDPHFGMYAWAAETGQSFDLDIAEANLMTAVDHLVALAPPADECLIINLGDFFHSDSHRNETTGGTRVDVDSRWRKVLSVGIRAMRRTIDQALTKHQRVSVICEIGNHDTDSSMMLALCLEALYEREPRVTIDTSPAKFHWFRFGKCLIGTTHGDKAKSKDLLGVMACDRATDWGETLHRQFYVGHVHHDSTKEYPGLMVETFRTLAPSDAWHKGMGYRSGQDLKLDVWHREHGKINRHIIGINQVWQLQGGSKA